MAWIQILFPFSFCPNPFDQQKNIGTTTSASLKTALKRAEVRRMNLQLIVATVHLDILQQLQPDWYFRSDSAQLMTFSGTCDRL